MIAYHITSAGSNTYPYDTSAKGANQFATVIPLLSVGDIILVSSNIVENVLVPFSTAVTVKSIDNTKYIISGVGNVFSLAFGSCNSDFIIDGLYLVNQFINSPFPPFTNTINVTNCYFKNSGPSFNTPCVCSLNIENCVFESTESYGMFAGVVVGYNLNDVIIKINNNVFINNKTNYNNMFGMITILSTLNTNSKVLIYNNIFYNQGTEPSGDFVFRPYDTNVKNIVFENNVSNLSNGFVNKPVNSVDPLDLMTLMVSRTNKQITSNPGFVGDGTNGYDDYYLTSSSLYKNFGYNGFEVGLGLIPVSVISPILSTTNISNVYTPSFSTDIDSKISILEKINRMVELYDPWKIPIEHIQHLAEGQGYSFGITRSDIENTEISLAEKQNRKKYLRFVTDQMSEFYRVKTTPASLQSLMMSFGVIGSPVYYYLDSYDVRDSAPTKINKLMTLVDSNISIRSVWESTNKPTSTENGDNEDTNSLNWVDPLTHDKWFVTRSRGVIGVDVSEIHRDAMPTPHFSIMLDWNKSLLLSTYDFDINKTKIICKAIDNVRPINTVFHNVFVLFDSGVMTTYYKSYTKVRTTLKLFNVA